MSELHTTREYSPGREKKWKRLWTHSVCCYDVRVDDDHSFHFSFRSICLLFLCLILTKWIGEKREKNQENWKDRKKRKTQRISIFSFSFYPFHDEPKHQFRFLIYNISRLSNKLLLPDSFLTLCWHFNHFFLAPFFPFYRANLISRLSVRRLFFSFRLLGAFHKQKFSRFFFSFIWWPHIRVNVRDSNIRLIDLTSGKKTVLPFEFSLIFRSGGGVGIAEASNHFFFHHSRGRIDEKNLSRGSMINSDS